MRLSLWPRSLFGQLIAASILALLLAQLVSIVLIARERERFILQGTVREWSRRIAEVTALLQGMDEADRNAVAAKLSERPWRFGRRPPDALLGLVPEPDQDHRPDEHRQADVRPPLEGGVPHPDERGDVAGERREARSLLLRATTYPTVVPFSKAGDFEDIFEQQLRSVLGAGYEVHVSVTRDVSRRAIAISGPLFSDPHDEAAELYDTTVKFPDGYTALFRVTRFARGAPLPRGLFMNLALLVMVMSIALFVTARSITRPLSELARAADSVGRNLRQPKIAERGALELRNAARAFNTMQDRLQRYLDSRSRVLAAMSHDLKTPLTRLRLQVEMLEDSAGQARITRQLDEMEGMVHGALALFRGLDDSESFAPLDVNELLSTLQAEFAEMGADVSLEGHALRPILGKPLALRRGLTNLIANSVKFGTRAWVRIEDGATLIIRVRDDGPGIPDSELERVFEPFYRLESSRNRDTGGSGLGLSIARDVAQAHGGTLVLRNLPVSGLEAVLTLPRT